MKSFEQKTTLAAAEVADAVGVSQQVLKNWLHRGLFRTPLEETKRGRGRHFSLGNLFEAALLKQLNEAGFAFEDASKVIGDILANLNDTLEMLPEYIKLGQCPRFLVVPAVGRAVRATSEGVGAAVAGLRQERVEVLDLQLICDGAERRAPVLNAGWADKDHHKRKAAEIEAARGAQEADDD